MVTRFPKHFTESKNRKSTYQNLKNSSTMALLHGTYDFSVLAIPAYFVLAMIPHGWAVSVASQGKLSTWDNRNPRNTDLKAKLKARLPAEAYAKYERLEACHANSMESFPLFTAAVVLGSIAGLKKEDLTSFAAYFLAVRVAYIAVYATHKTQGPTVLRTGIWYVGVGLCFKTIVQAAKAMGMRA